MKCLLAQVNPTIGDFGGNVAKIMEAYGQGIRAGADLVICPEMVLTGYPPRDLLLKSHFLEECLHHLQSIAEQTGPVGLIVGTLDRNASGAGRPLYNAAVLLQKGKIIAKRYKTCLPTYDVFEEDRYFEPARDNTPIAYMGEHLGLTICEDAWSHPLAIHESHYGHNPLKKLKDQGASLLINIAASPWQVGKVAVRQRLFEAQSSELGLPVLYVNMVGGNDELIFDGSGMFVDPNRGVVAQSSLFEAQNLWVDTQQQATASPPEGPDVLDEEGQIIKALSLGIRDYVHKCGFQSVLLGLSGGIDSALTAVIAVEALGPEHVMGVAMPTRFSSEGSLTDASKLAETLGIRYEEIPIDPAFEVIKSSLSHLFADKAEDVTEENLQARIRGTTLMALSNKFGSLLLTTGNKSELAVGYCTLYGDMCGGLAVLSDCPKTMVYRLSRWINRAEEIIPWETIEKAPSAELRHDQKDQDSLPDYATLDTILKDYLVEHQSIDSIVSKGHDRSLVEKLIRLMDLNEYKRRQAAPGLKVTSRAFGMGRRVPIAQRFREKSDPT